MPEPRKGETRKGFVDRCMGDGEAVSDFPDNDQRFAFCNSKWESRSREALRALALIPLHEPCGCPVHRADEQQPIGNRQSTGHEDPFLKDEQAMALALLIRADSQSNKVRKIYDEVLSGSNFDEGAFNDATEEAERTWQKTWNDATEATVLAALIAALGSGERQISAGILQGVPSRQSVLDGMVAASKFYTNEFFNTQVIPTLQSKIAQILDGTPATEAPDIGAIRAVLDRRLKSVPYWRVVANAATSRSYHYGLLKAAQFQGHRTYTFTAILDERTSDICRELNGRTWFIADAVDLVERVASSDDPEEVKRLAPWVRLEDIQGQSGEALRALGVIVPPVHGNCRSTIRIT